MKKKLKACLSMVVTVALLMGLFVFPASAENPVYTILSTDFSDGEIPDGILNTWDWGTSSLSVIEEGPDDSECLKFVPEGDGENDITKTQSYLFFPTELDSKASSQFNGWRDAEITIAFDLKFIPGGTAPIYAGIQMCGNWNKQEGSDPVVGQDFTGLIISGEWVSLSTTFVVSDYYPTEGGICTYLTYSQADSADPEYWIDNVEITMQQAETASIDPNDFDGTNPIWTEDFETSTTGTISSIFATTDQWRRQDLSIDNGLDDNNTLKFVRGDMYNRGIVIEIDKLSANKAWMYHNITFSYDYKMESANSEYTTINYAIKATYGHDFNEWEPTTAVRDCADSWAAGGVPKGTWQRVTVTIDLVDLFGKSALDAALTSGDGIQLYIISWPEQKMDLQQHFDNFEVTATRKVVKETIDIWEEDFENAASVPAIFTTVDGTRTDMSIDEGNDSDGLKFIPQYNWDFVALHLHELQTDTSWLYQDIVISYDIKVEFDENFVDGGGKLEEDIYNIDWGIRVCTNSIFNEWAAGSTVEWAVQAWTPASPAFPKNGWITVSGKFNLVDILGKSVIDNALEDGGVQLTFEVKPSGVGAFHSFDNFKISIQRPVSVRLEKNRIQITEILMKNDDEDLALDQNDDQIVDILDLLIIKELLIKNS